MQEAGSHVEESEETRRPAHRRLNLAFSFLLVGLQALNASKQPAAEACACLPTQAADGLSYKTCSKSRAAWLAVTSTNNNCRGAAIEFFYNIRHIECSDTCMEH